MTTISHYKIKDALFVDYMDAIDHCDQNNYSYNEIIKTKSITNTKTNDDDNR